MSCPEISSQIKIKPEDIDCPEMKQEFGNRAMQDGFSFDLLDTHFLKGRVGIPPQTNTPTRL